MFLTTISTSPQALINSSASTPQNGQTLLNNSSAFADKLFELWLTILWGWRLKGQIIVIIIIIMENIYTAFFVS